jgi:hypothetical protein
MSTDKEETYRLMHVAVEGEGKTPSTLDEEHRSVGIIVTSTNPVTEYDYRTDSYMPTVILPEGVQLPENSQAPLIDSHMRGTVDNQLGSVRDFQVVGDELHAIAHYASDSKSDRTFGLVKEGHLTDYSIGCRTLAAEYLKEGESAQYHGRTLEGPLKVITESSLIEVSVTPVGADSKSKNRSAAEIAEDKQSTEAHSSEEPRMQPQNEEVRAMSTSSEKVEKAEAVDVESIKRAAIKAEKTRVAAIQDLGTHYKVEESVIRGLIDGDVSAEVARTKVLEEVAERYKKESLNKPEVTRGSNDTFENPEFLNRAMEDAIAERAGVKVEEAAKGSEAFRGMGMVEIAREMLRHTGKDHTGSQYDVVGRALATSDFPILCGNIANKSMLIGFNGQEESYGQWCDTSGSVSDFKTHTLARAGEFGDLEEVKEGEEYKYDSVQERSESFKVAKYGKLFQITREALINDDLNELMDTARKMGESAGRKLGDLAYGVLTANPVMGDGNPLFDLSHNNIGTPAAIGVDSYGEAELLMALQKDISNLRRLNIDPAYVVMPRALKTTAEVFFRTERYADSDTGATRTNIYNNAAQRVYDSRLDDNSALSWYVLGNKGQTVKMFFLNGNSTPYMERNDEFTRDAASWKVRIEAVAKALDWRGMVFNAGA